MSSITTDQGIVHYEVFGRGRPVILLHGWLGSWGLWQETMTFLGPVLPHLCPGFLGVWRIGQKTQHLPGEGFYQPGRPVHGKAGHHLGAAGRAQYGRNGQPIGGHTFPERVQKVVVIGSPIDGSSLALLLKLAGYRPIAWLLFNLFPVFRLAMRVASPLICRDPRFPDMMDQRSDQTHAGILFDQHCLPAPDRFAPELA